MFAAAKENFTSPEKNNKEKKRKTNRVLDVNQEK
jgi:hypothetical protein